VLRAGACVAALALADAPAATAPVDAAACQIVRLSDIGWTDVTSTTAIFSALLRHLGYRPQTPVL
jgi:glycine betaine/proline transport system substrate-binding protein